MPNPSRFDTATSLEQLYRFLISQIHSWLPLFSPIHTWISASLPGTALSVSTLPSSLPFPPLYVAPLVVQPPLLSSRFVFRFWIDQLQSCALFHQFPASRDRESQSRRAERESKSACRVDAFTTLARLPVQGVVRFIKFCSFYHFLGACEGMCLTQVSGSLARCRSLGAGRRSSKLALALSLSYLHRIGPGNALEDCDTTYRQILDEMDTDGHWKVVSAMSAANALKVSYRFGAARLQGGV